MRGRRQVKAHARLKHAEPLDDPFALRIEPGPVQRMGERADEPADRVPRHLSVGVEGNHKPCPRQRRRIGAARRVRGRAVAAKQPVEFRELPTLPLPAHPAVLGRVPHAMAMEEEKERGTIGRVPLVECLDALERFANQYVVFGLFLGIGVGEVGQKREANACVGVGQVVGFQPLAENLGAPRPHEHGRHDDERGKFFGNAFLEIKLG